MNCLEARNLLAAYLDDALQPGDRELVEAHVQGCAICQSEMNVLSKTQSRIRQLMSAHLNTVKPASNAWERLQLQLANQPEPALIEQSPLPRQQPQRAKPRTVESPQPSSAFRIFSLGFLGVSLLVFVALIIMPSLTPLTLSGQGALRATDTPVLTLTPTITPSPNPTPHITTGIIAFHNDENRPFLGRVAGTGSTAIILANMAVGDMRQWNTFVHSVDLDQFTVITFDWLGKKPMLANREIEIVLDTVRRGGYTRVICIGASMGVGACSHIANQPEMIGLVLISGDYGGGNLAMADYPKLFIAGLEDNHWLVSTRRLYDNAAKPKTLQLYETAAHGTDIFQYEPDMGYLLIDFVNSLLE